MTPVMGITLMTEYENAYKVLNMSIEQLEQCNRWAAEASLFAKRKNKVFFCREIY